MWGLAILAQVFYQQRMYDPPQTAPSILVSGDSLMRL